MKINICAQTDTGKERDQNEDAFIICPDLTSPDWGRSEATVELGSYGCLLAVADGMGGANAGEVAATLATDSLRTFFSSPSIAKAVASDDQIKEFIEAAIAFSNDAVNKHISAHPETLGMGTTIVVCWIVNGKAFVAWCGDSRCYVFNPNSGLQVLTKDHSFVQELVDKGVLTEQEAFSHPDNNIITRGLGDFDTSQPDIRSFDIHPYDLFLLCSDGLCGYCMDEAIEKTLKANLSNTNACCKALVNMALDAGGFDNISIALASVTDGEGRSSPIQKPFFKRLVKRRPSL